MNRALGGAGGALATGVLLALCVSCSSANENHASTPNSGGGAFTVGANAGNAGQSGEFAETGGNGASGGTSGASSGASGASSGASGADPNASGGRAGGAESSDAGAGANAGSNSNACKAETADAHPVPLDLLIMLDASGSMLDMTSTQSTKWDAVKGALEAFLEEGGSKGVGVGLQYFPIQKPNVPDACASDTDCGDAGPCALKHCFNSNNIVLCNDDADCQTSAGASAGPCVPLAFCSKNQDYLCANPGTTCQASGVSQDLGTCQKSKGICEHPTSCDVAQYEAPVVAISSLPNAAAALIASIDGKQPSGDTPTGPALSGALQQAKAWATAHRDHRVVTVLVTDGLPTECSPSTPDALAALAKASATSSPSINTFVIGVFGADDVTTTAPETVNQIAQQGGTEHAFIVDTKGDVTAQVQTALQAIRDTDRDCHFQLPIAPAGGAVDLGKVNVTVGMPTQSQVVRYVSDFGACDTVTGGWYYELSSGTPSQIVVCPATCGAVKNGGAAVKIAVGCATTR